MAAVDRPNPSAHAPAYAGFPRALCVLLRCPVDGGEFALEAAGAPTSHVERGELRCLRCARAVPIVAGIAHMLSAETLDAEERHEVALRDEQTRTLSPERERAYWASLYSRRETASTLKALELAADCTAVDLGCGTGRYTALLARACRQVLAVDFSLESLGWLARENAPGPNVGLVHGDITRLRLAPRAFDRALATTPLDSREQRLAMHHVAAEALGDGGVYVFSTEHYDLRSRLLGAPRAQRYRPGENLFFRLRRHEVEREAAPFFLDVRSKPINVSLPFSRRMPPPVRAVLSAAAERVPWVRDLGDLVLVRARQPLREPQEGVGSAGSRAFRYVRRLVRGASADQST
jgi:SAM-dependent methyltransferase